MMFLKQEGQLSVVDSEMRVVLQNIECGIYVLEGDKRLWQSAEGEWKISQKEDTWIASCDNMVLELRSQNKGMLIHGVYTANRDYDNVEELVLFRGTLPKHICHVFGNDVMHGNGNRTTDMCSGIRCFDMAPGETEEFGEGLEFTDSDGRIYVTGYQTFRKFFGQINLSEDGSIAARQFIEYHTLYQGETLDSDLFYLGECESYLQGAIEMADECVKAAGGALHNFDVPSGYCTWYYYFSGITGAELLNTLPTLKKEKEAGRLPIEYVQIDDGWQIGWGDWEANEKFPLGMKAYADAIREACLIPGIWLAPYGANPESKIFREHPEYFIRERGSDTPREGEWGKYNLDFSLPETKKYLADLIHKVTYDWGYRYLKLDIITSSTGPYVHHDRHYGALKNYLEGMRIIRENMAPGTFILGCTASFGASIGLVDGMRVGGDVNGTWERFRNSTSQLFNRFAYHNRYFYNDGDCLIVRRTENEDEFALLRQQLNETELTTFVTAIAATGGIMMMSDKMALLDDRQFALIGKLFPRETQAAVPLDYGTTFVPSLLDAGERNGLHRMLFFNWEDEEKTVRYPVHRQRGFSYWDQAYEGILQEDYSFTLPPHGVKVLFLTDAEKPCVIGCSERILPAICYETDGRSLTIHLEKENEIFWLALPGCSHADTDCGRIEKISDDGIWKLTPGKDAKGICRVNLHD